MLEFQLLPANQLGISTSQRMQSQTREAFTRPASSNKPVKPRPHKGWTVSAMPRGHPKNWFQCANLKSEVEYDMLLDSSGPTSAMLTVHNEVFAAVFLA
ncbi:hypothetical protein TRIATDRAFT_299497 [Trichoderma atroviride IMI 206040]|uniref:Uncharacterized protein n=1 Tax=Hypocrea atroviridis (strain ATCC 20476 / IMI 206040) TaxID=452589 RepID=G9NT91_HYPAI|nr:uncharacterized protein TRIATDRAFT_299497 [Trichoderma atroviride IMI 206040]EHK45938.1 hypothetical protein TRIATDRAFT_299497 [Trichoderma atroviride IMI 206040]